MRYFLTTVGKVLLVISFLIPVIIGFATGGQGAGYAVGFSIVGVLPLVILGLIIKTVGERMRDEKSSMSYGVILGAAVFCAFLALGVLILFFSNSGGSDQGLLYVN